MKKTIQKYFMGILLLMMVTGVFGGTINADSNSQKKSIQTKIMTYNIQAGQGMDDKLDLQRTAEEIRQSDADIIGLQEVDNHWSERSDFKDEAKELAEMLDMDYAFGANLDESPEEGHARNHQYGTAILSKHPIVDSENHELTTLSEDEEQRGLLEAQVNILGEEAWFYVTHLDENEEDSTTRARQVKDVLDITSDHKNNILVGDFNTPQNTSEAPELEPLLQNFTDTWDATQDSNGYTWPADSPTMRIDYIFTSPEIQVDSTQLIQTLSSDHLPVTAEVTLEAGENSLSADSMKKLVKYFEKQGEITNGQTVHSLMMHLISVSQFEDRNASQAVIQYMNSFETLLDHHKTNEGMSDKAYQTLKEDTRYLIEKWRNQD